MSLGATHWSVEPWVADLANDVIARFGGSWNTYVGHGLAPAAGETRTVDFWDPAGRGATLEEHRGDMITAWLLGQNEIDPVLILIWWSWIWLPGQGWAPYSGFQGSHGPGPDAHVHVGW